MTDEYDPGFVGEYMKVSLGVANYRDWRLLPGSPFKDAGYFDPNGVTSTNAQPWTWTESSVPQLQVFDVDGEGWGNPRVVDGAPDIGFDELHLITVAGSYANDSKSHDQKSSMNPSVPNSASNVRSMLMRPAGPSNELLSLKVVDGTYRLGLVNPSAANPPQGWTQPPGTLSTPVTQSGAPVDFNKGYINTLNRAPSPTSPSGWHPGTDIPNFTVVQWLDPSAPLSQAHFQFLLTSKTDPDSGAYGYFNEQLEIFANGSSVWWSNLQSEYR